MQWKDSRVLVRRFRSYETQQGKSFTIKWTLTKEFINAIPVVWFLEYYCFSSVYSKLETTMT